MRNIVKVSSIVFVLLFSFTVSAQELKVLSWEDFFPLNSVQSMAKSKVSLNQLELEFLCSVDVITIDGQGNVTSPANTTALDIVFFPDFENLIYHSITAQTKSMFAFIRVVNIDLLTWDVDKDNSFVLSDFENLQYIYVQSDSVEKLDKFLLYLKDLKVSGNEQITVVTKLINEVY